MHEAMLWETDGDRVRCGLCPHRCRIAEGHTGDLRRARERGRHAVRAHVRAGLLGAADPIEKKPVFHYRPGHARVLASASSAAR